MKGLRAGPSQPAPWPWLCSTNRGARWESWAAFARTAAARWTHDPGSDAPARRRGGASRRRAGLRASRPGGRSASRAWRSCDSRRNDGPSESPIADAPSAPAGENARRSANPAHWYRWAGTRHAPLQARRASNPRSLAAAGPPHMNRRIHALALRGREKAACEDSCACSIRGNPRPSSDNAPARRNSRRERFRAAPRHTPSPGTQAGTRIESHLLGSAPGTLVTHRADSTFSLSGRCYSSTWTRSESRKPGTPAHPASILSLRIMLLE